jgi:hypothetical protein
MEKNRPSLDSAPPGPPEMQVRRGLQGVVSSRDSSQNGPTGAMPGLGGANAIAEKAMAAEKALGDLAQVMPDPGPITEVLTRLRAAVVQAMQSGGGPPQGGAPGGVAGIVAPPPPISPPAAGGIGMPAPPLQ